MSLSTKFYKYGTLYAALVANHELNIKYIMINTFLTLEGVRPACIIGLTNASHDVFKKELSEKGIRILAYNDLFSNSIIKRKNYLIINPNTSPSLLSSTLPIIRRGANNEDYHVATGKLLGYMKPMNIFRASGGQGAQIAVELDYEKIQGVMPQRVGDATNKEILDYYKKPLDLLEDAYKNPTKYDYFPLKFTAPPELIVKEITSGSGTRKLRRTRRRANRSRRRSSNRLEYS